MVAALRQPYVVDEVVVDETGAIRLPTQVLDALGVKSGGGVLLYHAEQGVLVTTKKIMANWFLDRIGDELREAGVTLEELIESGAEIRQQIYDEKYAVRSEE